MWMWYGTELKGGINGKQSASQRARGDTCVVRGGWKFRGRETEGDPVNDVSRVVKTANGEVMYYKWEPRGAVDFLPYVSLWGRGGACFAV